MEVGDELLRLVGGDPFADVLTLADAHREEHGPRCGLHPAGPAVMRLAATLVRSSGARRIADLGTGIGYSALWLADAAGPGAHVLAVDRFPEHVAEARRLSARYGLADRIELVAAEAGDALDELEPGSLDLVHDDAWFAHEPAHLEAMVERLRPGGTLTMPNWFLLEDALSGRPRRDWSAFAGPDWAAATRAYADRLAVHPGLAVTWVLSPPLGIAVRRRQGGPRHSARTASIVPEASCRHPNRTAAGTAPP